MKNKLLLFLNLIRGPRFHRSGLITFRILFTSLTIPFYTVAAQPAQDYHCGSTPFMQWQHVTMPYNQTNQHAYLIENIVAEDDWVKVISFDDSIAPHQVSFLKLAIYGRSIGPWQSRLNINYIDETKGKQQQWLTISGEIAYLSDTAIVAAEQARALIDEQDTCVIDVRLVEHFKRAHIPGSWHGPVQAMLAQQPHYQAKPVIIIGYGYVDKRVIRCYNILLGAGFSEVYILKGGIAAWSKAGLPCRGTATQLPYVDEIGLDYFASRLEIPSVIWVTQDQQGMVQDMPDLPVEIKTFGPLDPAERKSILDQAAASVKNHFIIGLNPTIENHRQFRQAMQGQLVAIRGSLGQIIEAVHAQSLAVPASSNNHQRVFVSGGPGSSVHMPLDQHKSNSCCP